MFCQILVLAIALGIIPVPQSAQAPGPSPEFQRFSRLVVGRYKVLEQHHARPGRPEWTVEGTSTYRPGPEGLSVVEDYQSSSARGPFAALAVLWWEPALGAFKHFECEAGEPCGVLEDQGRWEGDVLVFRGETERQGRKVRLEKQYDFSKPGTFVYRECASVDGGPVSTLMTITHTRLR